MYQVKDIRTYIMGVSILSIMLFHTEGFFIVPKWIEFIQRTGFLGVDIFFFVSAYGLCYSMKKKTSLRLWYIKRFKRIVPAFLLAIIFYKAVFLIFDEKDNSLNISALIDSFLHYLVVFWYIPALLLFYLVFPCLYNNRRYLNILVIPIAILSYWLTTITINLWGGHDYVSAINSFFYRIPVFVVGIIYADEEERIIKMSTYSKILYIGLSYIAFVILQINVIQITGSIFFLLIISLPFICWLCGICYKYLKIFNPIILFCGKYSLELYLIHVIFKAVVINKVLFESINANYTFIGAYLLSFPCAWLFSKFVSKLIQKA